MKNIVKYVVSVLWIMEGVMSDRVVLAEEPVQAPANTVMIELKRCEVLEKAVRLAKSLPDKLSILDAEPAVQAYLAQDGFVKEFLASNKDVDKAIAIKSVLALGQGPVVFGGAVKISDREELFNKLLVTLQETERFYNTMGGIIGYHTQVLRLITEKKRGGGSSANYRYLEPEGLDVTQDTFAVRQSTLAGIKELGKLAELYPVGGAGDRLDLRDEVTEEPWPAAKLPFLGRSLLEGLVRDLQGREYLHYKLYGDEVITPIAMMTSSEKNNHQYITQVCRESKWFGRPESRFNFFQQPLVPVITEEGHWSLKAPLQLTLKPGGHGVVWKLASDSGILDWFERQGRRKVLVRQINNPVAGLDIGLAAFTGEGLGHDKVFGFASCRRLVHSAEGTDVIIEKEINGQYSYCLTNIEYTDFATRGIQDVPAKVGSLYSAYPSNTNILFADIAVVKRLCHDVPVPGMLINMKSRAPYLAPDGTVREVFAGRLESLMQNIADHIIDSYPHPLSAGERQRLSSYVTFNERAKTISATKNSFVAGKSEKETPEGAYYDLMSNMHSLLVNECKMKVKPLNSVEDYLKKGPNLIFLYHPAMGPSYSVIGQKIRGGTIEPGSELQLEIADVDIENLHLSGSLLVEADSVMGSWDKEGILHYNNGSGKCTLQNVKILNDGIERGITTRYWKNELFRKESLTIVLHGNAEFVARDVTLTGDHVIEVPTNTRMTAYKEGNRTRYRIEKIDQPSWGWAYNVQSDGKIALQKEVRFSEGEGGLFGKVTG